MLEFQNQTGEAINYFTGRLELGKSNVFNFKIHVDRNCKLNFDSQGLQFGFKINNIPISITNSVSLNSYINTTIDCELTVMIPSSQKVQTYYPRLYLNYEDTQDV
jgi:hypothetical protein